MYDTTWQEVFDAISQFRAVYVTNSEEERESFVVMYPVMLADKSEYTILYYDIDHRQVASLMTYSDGYLYQDNLG